MRPIPADLRLNLNARSELALRSGDSVFLTVVKRLSGNKWAVAIRGKVVPALSEVELSPGQKLRAVVRIRGGRLTLSISGRTADPIREVILSQGLQPSKELEQVVGAFLRAGLALLPERLQAARRILQRQKLDPKRYARLLAMAMDKGIQPASPGLDRLLPLLGLGEEGPGDQRRRRRRMPADSDRLAEQLQQEIEESAGAQNSGLQVFNHLRGSRHTWVIIPFDYGYEKNRRIYGTIRLRYDAHHRRSDRMIVKARTASGTGWSFLLQAGAEKRMFLFADSTESTQKTRGELDVLLLKLQNLGVKTDDTIREEQNFDGFDLPWEELSYRTVDTIH